MVTVFVQWTIQLQFNGVAVKSAMSSTNDGVGLMRFIVVRGLASLRRHSPDYSDTATVNAMVSVVHRHVTLEGLITDNVTRELPRIL